MLRKKTFWQVTLALLMLLLCVFFIKNEHLEFLKIRDTLIGANLYFVALGVLVTGIYIFLQAYMYVKSFHTIGQDISIKSALELFLKRNLISVFLPAGGFASLAFFTKNIEKQNISKTQIYYASYVYGICGLITVAVVAIPTILYLLFKNALSTNILWAFGALLLLIFALFYIARSLYKKGTVYKLLLKFRPGLAVTIDELESNEFNLKQFLLTNLVSMGIEIIGIAHLYIAMLVLGLPPSLEVAAIGYVVMVIFLIVSPFLRGMGAIEVTMTYVLIHYGYSMVIAASVTLLFRLFEFWLPLIAGVTSFISKRESFIFRILPAISIFGLGMINIISSITPAIPGRLRLLEAFISGDIIYTSNYFVLVFGLILSIISIYLLRGVRNAWYIALVLSFLSMFGHLSKAIDYEEAIMAFVAFSMLLFTRKSYITKHDSRFQRKGLLNISIVVGAVLVYGIIGFYFLEKRHFNIEFDLKNSIFTLLRIFFLFDTTALVPKTHFANWFLYSIYLSGSAAIIFIIYTIVKPYVMTPEVADGDQKKADEIMNKSGNSALDFFKVYFDKLYFFSDQTESFVSYNISGNYAFVLENPVLDDHANLSMVLCEFEKYCYHNGLKPIYYRVPEEDLPVYYSLGKRSLIIGQEAIINLDNFSLEGGKMKSIRNAINKIESSGCQLKIYTPPLKSGLVQKLKQVSDEWLTTMERKEMIFSQGLFHPTLIKENTVFTVENNEEKVVAFANIVPDKFPNEGTYDLIRKSNDAPNGVMDYLLVNIFKYLKDNGFKRVNLGLAPMSGLDKAGNIPERTIKFAYENFRQFEHYKGLREYKEKFFPQWASKYLVYTDIYDLLQIPAAISDVTRFDDEKEELMESRLKG
jgi:phosphatidylglycerol lysyltransferase